jgi:hypothetical protein
MPTHALPRLRTSLELLAARENMTVDEFQEQEARVHMLHALSKGRARELSEANQPVPPDLVQAIEQGYELFAEWRHFATLFDTMSRLDDHLGVRPS